MVNETSNLENDETLAVDNGIWLEALFFGGAGEELVKMAISGKVRLMTSEDQLVQLATTLQSELNFSAAAVDQVLALIRDCSEVVAADVPQAGEVLQFPAKVLSAAKRGGATAIATTGRSALLNIGSYEGIPIVSSTR